MDIEISGTEETQGDLSEMQQVMVGLQGELETLRFDPADPHDVSTTIERADQIIEDGLAPYRNAPWVEEIETQFKAAIRESVAAQSEEV